MERIDLSQIRFGACAWGYEMLKPGDVVGFKRVAEKVAGLPFPKRAEVIEILDILDNDSHEANMSASSEINKIAEGLGLIVIVTAFNPAYLPSGVPSPHLTSEDGDERKEAKIRINRGIIHANSYSRGKRPVILNGPSAFRHGYFPKGGLREGEHELLIDSLGSLGSSLSDHNVELAIEPLNHGETYLFMPGDESLELVKKIRGGRVGLNLDTCHYAQDAGYGVNESLSKALRAGKGFNLHLSENDRRQFGRGDIGARIVEIMRDVSRNIPAERILPITLENFCPELYPTLRIHRADKKSPEEVVYAGANYITHALHPYI